MEDFHKKILVVILIVGVLTVMSPQGLKLTGGSVQSGCKIIQYYGPCSEIGDGTWVPDPDNVGWCMQCPYENYKTSE